MPCEKTGCHVYLAQYGEYVYGDAFVEGGVHFFRLTKQRERQPLLPHLHYTVYDIAEWFDKANESVPYSTLIGRAVEYHGYEGKEI